MRTAILALFALAVASLPARAGDARDLSKTIDSRVNAALAKDKLAPTPRAEQHELLRRIYLDVLGRIPTPEEADAYLKDTDPDRHHKLIDALLAHPEMPVYWRGVFNHWLNGTLEEKRAGADEFLAFLENRLADNAGWNKIARELLDPNDGDAVSAGAAYFLASRLTGDRAEQLDAMTVAVSSAFFGVQMQCAKCHNHPFVEDWKQENYYGLAAFFGRTYTAKGKFGNAPALTEKGDGVVKFSGRGKPEQTAKLLFLDNKVSDAKSGARKALADAGVNATSPYFKRAMANRMWKQLMGVGLVEPVDQIFEITAASHPELLADLAADFATNNFDLRRLMGGILHSDAYLRSSKWTGTGTRPEPKHYAVGAIKPLAPPQLGLALAQATGHADVLRARYARDKAKFKDPVTLAVVRKQFEKEREYATLLTRFKQDTEPFQANAAHALYLTYNPAVKAMLAPTGLVGKLSKLKDGAEVARAAYLAVLSRLPGDDEAAEITKHLATPGVAREELCRDVVWALVAGTEFRFNH